MSIDSATVQSILFKKFNNKSHTANDKPYFAETRSSNFLLHSDDIWVDPIPYNNPAQAISLGIAEKVELLELQWDNTVAENRGYFAYRNSNYLTNWISPKHGALFQLSVYDKNNNKIDLTDPMEWIFDYNSGIFVATAPTLPTGYSNKYPFKITGYIYTGITLSEKLSTGLGSTGKLKTDLGDPTEGYLIDKIDATLFNINLSTHRLTLKDSSITSDKIIDLSWSKVSKTGSSIADLDSKSYSLLDDAPDPLNIVYRTDDQLISGKKTFIDKLTVGTNSLLVDPASNKVAIGTSLGEQVLELGGAIRLQTAISGTPGTVQYKDGDFQGFDGVSWKSFLGAAGGNVSSVGNVIIHADTDNDNSGNIYLQVANLLQNMVLLKSVFGIFPNIDERLLVGIGVTPQTQALELYGAIKVGDTDQNSLGSIRYHNGDIEGYVYDINNNNSPSWITLSRSIEHRHAVSSIDIGSKTLAEYLNSDIVHTSGNETISGIKTFANIITTNGTINETLDVYNVNVTTLNTANATKRVTLDNSGLYAKSIVIGGEAIPVPGAIQWTGTDFRGYNGSGWATFTATKSSSFITSEGLLFSYNDKNPTGSNKFSVFNKDVEVFKIDSNGDVSILAGKTLAANSTTINGTLFVSSGISSGSLISAGLISANSGLLLGQSSEQVAGLIKYSTGKISGYDGTTWIDMGYANHIASWNPASPVPGMTKFENGLFYGYTLIGGVGAWKEFTRSDIPGTLFTDIFDSPPSNPNRKDLQLTLDGINAEIDDNYSDLDDKITNKVIYFSNVLEYSGGSNLTDKLSLIYTYIDDEISNTENLANNLDSAIRADAALLKGNNIFGESTQQTSRVGSNLYYNNFKVVNSRNSNKSLIEIFNDAQQVKFDDGIIVGKHVQWDTTHQEGQITVLDYSNLLKGKISFDSTNSTMSLYRGGIPLYNPQDGLWTDPWIDLTRQLITSNDDNNIELIVQDVNSGINFVYYDHNINFFDQITSFNRKYGIISRKILSGSETIYYTNTLGHSCYYREEVVGDGSTVHIKYYAHQILKATYYNGYDYTELFDLQIPPDQQVPFVPGARKSFNFFGTQPIVIEYLTYDDINESKERDVYDFLTGIGKEPEIFKLEIAGPIKIGDDNRSVSAENKNNNDNLIGSIKYSYNQNIGAYDFIGYIEGKGWTTFTGVDPNLSIYFDQVYETVGGQDLSQILQNRYVNISTSDSITGKKTFINGIVITKIFSDSLSQSGITLNHVTNTDKTDLVLDGTLRVSDSGTTTAGTIIFKDNNLGVYVEDGETTVLKNISIPDIWAIPNQSGQIITQYVQNQISDMVTKSGSQTISGDKTFTGINNFTSTVTVTGDITIGNIEKLNAVDATFTNAIVLQSSSGPAIAGSIKWDGADFYGYIGAEAGWRSFTSTIGATDLISQTSILLSYDTDNAGEDVLVIKRANATVSYFDSAGNFNLIHNFIGAGNIDTLGNIVGHGYLSVTDHVKIGDFDSENYTESQGIICFDLANTIFKGYDGTSWVSFTEASSVRKINILWNPSDGGSHNSLMEGILKFDGGYFYGYTKDGWRDLTRPDAHYHVIDDIYTILPGDPQSKNLYTFLTDSYVSLVSNQTIGGNKTLSGQTIFTNSVTIQSSLGVTSGVNVTGYVSSSGIVLNNVEEYIELGHGYIVRHDNKLLYNFHNNVPTQRSRWINLVDTLIGSKPLVTFTDSFSIEFNKTNPDGSFEGTSIEALSVEMILDTLGEKRGAICLGRIEALSPRESIDTWGAIVIGDTNTSTAGAIKYAYNSEIDKDDFLGFNGEEWQSLTIAQFEPQDISMIYVGAPSTPLLTYLNNTYINFTSEQSVTGKKNFQNISTLTLSVTGDASILNSLTVGYESSKVYMYGGSVTADSNIVSKGYVYAKMGIYINDTYSIGISSGDLVYNNGYKTFGLSKISINDVYSGDYGSQNRRLLENILYEDLVRVGNYTQSIDGLKTFLKDLDIQAKVTIDDKVTIGATASDQMLNVSGPIKIGDTDPLNPGKDAEGSLRYTYNELTHQYDIQARVNSAWKSLLQPDITSIFSNYDIVLHYDTDGNNSGKFYIRTGPINTQYSKNVISISNSGKVNIGGGQAPAEDSCFELEIDGAFKYGGNLDTVVGSPGGMMFNGDHFFGYTSGDQLTTDENGDVLYYDIEKTDPIRGWLQVCRKYVHKQVTPASTWTISHKLKTKLMALHIFQDIGGGIYQPIGYQSLKVIDSNTIEVYFFSPIGGYLVFIG